MTPISLRLSKICLYRPLILFGAGGLGRHVLAQLRAAGIGVSGFADNDTSKWEKLCEGLDVLPPQHIPPDALCLVTVYHGDEVRQQLRLAGIDQVHYLELLPDHKREYADAYGTGYPNPELIAHNLPRIFEAAALIREETSRREFFSQLEWRATCNRGCLAPHSPQDEVYFPPEFPLTDEEYFVDCGAYTGDTFEEFLKRKERFVRYVAFEPNPDVYCQLARVSIHPDFVPLHFAVGDKNEDMHLSGSGMGAKIDSEGVLVRCMTLDSFAFWPWGQVTRIKMDVEEYERQALNGAWRTIQCDRPLLIVCAYHRPDDLWEIPLLIHEIVPDYDFMLRRYQEDCWELVWYAFPKEMSPWKWL